MARDSSACSFDARLDKGDFVTLASFVHRICGIHLPPSKFTMLESRLRKRLRVLGMDTFAQYLSLLNDPDGQACELPRLLETVTTNKTEFFREPAHFEFLARDGIRLLTKLGAGKTRPLRAWSAACSTGEEPYTLAMVLAEISKDHLPRGFEILASDISQAVLHTAQRGIYAKAATADIPEPYRSRYLMHAKDRALGLVRIIPDLRRVVGVTTVNLNDKSYPTNGPLDLIFCRNVLIYFDNAKKLEILTRITEHLLSGGLLCLGHADSIAGMRLPLQPLLPSIYQRM